MNIKNFYLSSLSFECYFEYSHCIGDFLYIKDKKNEQFYFIKSSLSQYLKIDTDLQTTYRFLWIFDTTSKHRKYWKTDSIQNPLFIVLKNRCLRKRNRIYLSATS